jgi:hypothetical protein
MKKLLIKFLITCQLLVFSQSVFGQELAKNRIFVLQDFSGGVASKMSDQITNPKYARIAENIRLGTAVTALTKRDQIFTYGTADTSEAITGLFRLYKKDTTKYLVATHGDEIELGSDTTGVFTPILALTTGDYRWAGLTWHDLLIMGDGYNQPVKFDGTTATYLGTCAGVDSGAGTGPVAGTYAYKVSFYTASYEVIFNVASAAVVNGAGDHDISLTNIPIGPDTYLTEAVTGRKIYRNKLADQTHWFLLTNGTIANNTATTLTDSDTDAGISATAYPAGSATWTPPLGKFYLLHQNRLFIANNPTYPSRIYYSKDGSHELFETSTDYFDIRQNDGDEITGIFNLLGILTISKTNTWQKLYTNGDDPSADWEISDPFSGAVGCDTPYSAKTTPIGIMYLSRNKSGIYVFNGMSSSLKSDKVTPDINDILTSNLYNVCGEYNNNIYYLTYTSGEVAGSTNNRVLVYDILLDAFTIDTLSINAFCSLTGGSDGGTLYAGSSNSGKVYQFSNTTKQVIHSKHSDFYGTFDDARYIPVGTAGGDSNSPIIELAWDNTINDIATTVNNTAGDIDRPDTDGTYISPVLNTLGANVYDKLYWNETLLAGTDATFAIRSGATSAACQAAAWSSEYTLAAGSDISALSANEYTQYRISLSTADIDFTPYVTTLGGYTVKLTYGKLGAVAETGIALHWQSGWLDFSDKGYKKVLRKILTSHSGSNGVLTVTVTNEVGETDSWDINLGTYPSHYEEYTTNGAFLFNKLKIDITNSDLNSVKISEVIFVYDLEPTI